MLNEARRDDAATKRVASPICDPGQALSLYGIGSRGPRTVYKRTYLRPKPKVAMTSGSSISFLNLPSGVRKRLGSKWSGLGKLSSSCSIALSFSRQVKRAWTKNDNVPCIVNDNGSFGYEVPSVDVVGGRTMWHARRDYRPPSDIQVSRFGHS